MSVSRILAPALTILALVLLIGCQGGNDVSKVTSAPFVISLDEAKTIAAERGQNILIDFYSDSCKWCRRLDSVVFKDSAAVDYFSNRMVLAKINAKIDTSMAESFRISGYPTAVIIDKDGMEIDRIVGYMDPPDYLQTLKDYQNGIGTLDDLIRQADTIEDRQLFFDIAEKYKYRGGIDEADRWYHKVIDMGEPTDSVSGDCRMAMADMIRRAKDYDRAVDAFREIMTDFEGQWYAMDAEIYVAICHAQEGDTVAAIAAYEGYIDHFPESPDVDFAQSEINKLKGIPEDESEH